MIIGPLSTLSNWVAEFERWCPTIPVILYHGSRAERQKLRTSRMPTGKCFLHFWDSYNAGFVHSGIYDVVDLYFWKLMMAASSLLGF